MEDLIIKAKQGDKEAFIQAVLLIKNSLYKIAKMRTSREEDVQDIMQDTMIDAFKNIKKLKDINKFKSWMIKILINNCNKYYKKYYLEENYDIDSYKEEIKYFYDNQNLVESTLSFYEMIKCLKYEERIIIILYYSEKYTIKEISKILGINENTIKTRLLRAKEKIKIDYKGGRNNG